MEFPEALRVLAKRAGITLIQSSFSSEASSKKDKLYLLNKAASNFYHYVLTKHAAGKRALSYLKKRNIDERLIATFEIGFSPASGSALSDYLIRKKQYKADDLIEAGLAARRGIRVFDFFSGRLMFPLTDHRGNILGFSGRSLDDKTQPKYINTRDTLIYHKGDVFFGFHLTKDAVKKADSAVLVEGEFDVISCFREGITNVVGIKGTALTPNQVQLLSRFAKRAVLCFDNDAAGYEAMCRSIPLLEKQNMVIYTAVLSSGKDPDEAIANDRIEFKKAVSDHVSVYDYLLTRAVSTHGTQTADKKRAIADTLLPLFTTIQNEIVKEHYLRKISTMLDTSYESIVKEEEKLNKQEKVIAIPVKKLKRTREELLEEYLLALLLQEHVSEDILENVKQSLSALIDVQRATQKLLVYLFLQKDRYTVSEKGTADIPTELVEMFHICLLYPLPLFISQQHRRREILLVISMLRKLYARKKIQHLSEESAQDEDADLSQLSSLIGKA